MDNEKFMNALVKKMVDYYQLEANLETGRIREQDPNKLNNILKSVDNAILNHLGISESNATSQQILSDVKEQARDIFNNPPPSLLEKAVKKTGKAVKRVFGYKKGGSVGYTQRWANARKKKK